MKKQSNHIKKILEQEPETPKFEEKIISIDRITRVVEGGRRLRFRALVVIGDKNGRLGLGLDKANDISEAVKKATAQAYKNVIELKLKETTIPCDIKYRYGGTKIILKPAPRGRGIIAGGAVRIVVEVAGIKDITAKILGSTNKINAAKAAYLALKELSQIKERK